MHGMIQFRFLSWLLLNNLGISRKGSNETYPRQVAGALHLAFFPSFYHLLLWLRAKHMSNLV